MELDYKDLVRQLKSCRFTVINPELAGNAATAIQLLSERLEEYEDTGLTPEKFKESADYILKLNKEVKKFINNLRYYLETNEEKGVVYMPRFIIERMVNNIELDF